MSNRSETVSTGESWHDPNWLDPDSRDPVRQNLRSPATLGVAMAIAAYVAVAVSITNVVGGTGNLWTVLFVSGAAGLVLASILSVRQIGVVSIVLFVAGSLGYYFSLSPARRQFISVETVAYDTLSLATGLSILRIVEAELFLLMLVPVPTLLACYLAGRGRHVAGASVAGGMLGLFVLTGDATGAMTLFGVLGVALAAGLATLSTPGGLRSQWDTLAVVVVLMVIASATITVVPGGAGQQWGAGAGPSEFESSLVGTDEELTIVGGVSLSPEVRFTVESEAGDYWQTGSYDRFTGDGWVRTGESEPYVQRQTGPPGETRTVNQTLTTHTETTSIPAAWKPVAVDSALIGNVDVAASGDFRLSSPISEGETVEIESEVLDASPAELREAPTNYSSGIEERYTQLPADTSDRLAERTEEVIDDADAENPYDAAVAIERHLEESKDYSLAVDRPDGNIADAFLFEMEAGYCTYFATTMVSMLRSEGIPAKFATGYGSGQQVAEDEWVVRGQDAHAWVKVYFPEHGWVTFDPTPSAERAEARETRLADGRQGDEPGIDTDETLGEDEFELEPDESAPENVTDFEFDESAGTAGSEPDLSNPLDVNQTPPSPGAGPSGPPDGDGLTGGDIDLDDLDAEDEQQGEDEQSDETASATERIGYWGLILLGILAGAHHVGATTRSYRAVWLQMPIYRRDDRTAVVTAYRKLEYLLGRRYRKRRPGETPRAYLDDLANDHDLDQRARVVLEAYERAQYAGGVTPEQAADAKRAIRGLVLKSTPIVGRFFRGGQ